MEIDTTQLNLLAKQVIESTLGRRKKKECQLKRNPYRQANYVPSTCSKSIMASNPLFPPNLAISLLV